MVITDIEITKKFKPILKTKKCYECGLVLNMVSKNNKNYIVHPASNCLVFTLALQRMKKK